MGRFSCSSCLTLPLWTSCQAAVVVLGVFQVLYAIVGIKRSEKPSKSYSGDCVNRSCCCEGTLGLVRLLVKSRAGSTCPWGTCGPVVGENRAEFSVSVFLSPLCWVTQFLCPSNSLQSKMPHILCLRLPSIEVCLWHVGWLLRAEGGAWLQPSGWVTSSQSFPSDG